jgi:peptidoglycan/xylan/chitin deacetylase (PgdA/CDA1 family)
MVAERMSGLPTAAQGSISSLERPAARSAAATRVPPSFRRLLKRFAFRAACALGVHHLARRLNRRKLLIVGYHGLLDGEPPPGAGWLLLSRARFERQLRFLSRHYRLLDIDRAIGELRDGGLLEPTACITFDDGYRSNRDALALLDELDTTATISLATGGIGTDRLLWTTRLELAFQATDRTSIDLSRLGLGTVVLDSAAGRARTARSVIGRLKRMAPGDRDGALSEVRRALAADAIDQPAAFAMLSWDEVAELERTGRFRFGAHTVDHEIVSHLDDITLDTQIRDSIETVAERTERPSRTFAYPNGRAEDFDGRAAAAIRAAGGNAAVSTIDGLNTTATDPFALRRLTVGSDMGFDEFRLRAAGLLWRRAGA